jgi:hypothetical protein
MRNTPPIISRCAHSHARRFTGFASAYITYVYAILTQPSRTVGCTIRRRRTRCLKGEPPMRKALRILLLILGATSLATAQKLNVKIVNREDQDTSYDYAGVYSIGGSTTATSTTFHVTGATLTLQLPDGRTAVVNCASKFAEHFAGAAGNRRSCHVPLVDDIEADFHGDSAKLTWNVSIDGKKNQSETYRILGVMGKPQESKSQ